MARGNPKIGRPKTPGDKWRDRIKDWGTKRTFRPRENLIEKMGGSEKAKPHSTKEGRVASGTRRITRILEKQKPKTAQPRPIPKLPKPKRIPGRQPPTDPRSPYVKDRVMTPLRAKKAIGGAVKTIPKITKRFLDFIKTGKHVDKHGVKTNIPKAAERLTGKPHVDHGKRKRTKHLGKGKAAGGRIGFQHGGRTNLLEELGRVEGERSNRNRRAEVSRIHGELNRGYKSGGAVLKGKKVGIQIK